MSRDIVDKPATQLLFVLGCRFLRSGANCQDKLFQAAVPRCRKQHLRQTGGALPSQTLEGALGPEGPHLLRRHWIAALMAYSFDDGHIAVRTVHSVKHVPTHQSSITRHGKVALSVKYVAADLSSITTIPSGTDCQICHELRHCWGHRAKALRRRVSRRFRAFCLR